MESVLRNVKSTYTGKAEIKKVDLTENIEPAYTYEIRVVPTIIFFDEKGEIFYRNEGYMDEDAIAKIFEKMGVK